jgi:ribokinase
MVIGSANVDLTVKLEELPRTGETVTGGEYYTAFGGKGANQAVAALKAGAEVQFIARLGRDQNGQAISAHFAELGLSTDGIHFDESLPTGIALIMVDRLGRNMIAVAPGSNQSVAEQEIGIADPLMTQGDVLLVQLEIPLPTVHEALRLARSRDMLTILNPAPAVSLSGDLLACVDIITPNETELGNLVGMKTETRGDVIKAASQLSAMGVGCVIVTLGGEGVQLVQHGTAKAFSAIPVDPVDSTAAGDAFNGALACALAEGKPVEEAIPFANAAGALAVTRRGAQSSLPTRDEILDLLKHT